MAILTEQAKELILIDLPFVANESLASSQYCIVSPVAASAGAPKVGLPGGQGVLSIGALLNAPASGAVAEVRVAGIAKVKANGAFNAGIQLTVADTAGTVAAAISGDFVVGIALEASTGAGHLVSVFLTPGGQLN